MTIHSASRPIFGNKTGSLTLASKAAPTIVVDSPPSNKVRMVGGCAGGDGSEVETLPLSFLVFNDSPAGVATDLSYRLMLMPAGIQIQKLELVPLPVGNRAVLAKTLAIVPGEWIELEILPTTGADWKTAKFMASFKDYSREIVRVGRTLLTAEYKNVIPPPPVGSQNIPVASGGGDDISSACFYTNVGAMNGSADLQLNDNDVLMPRQLGQIVAADGTASFAEGDIILKQNQSLQARNTADGPVYAITTWLEISEPATV